jgi:hypothetical protein
MIGLIAITSMILWSLLPVDFASSGSSNTSVTTSSFFAMSLDEIRCFGIIASSGRGSACTSLSQIPIYADPELSEQVDSIPSWTIVKYERLSEIRRIPYWAARRTDRLPEGERFRIMYDSSVGWIGENDLMTFSSLWKQYSTENYLKVHQPKTGNIVAVAVYSNGQAESAICCALTIWEWVTSIWKLRELLVQPIGSGLYMIPQIDSLYSGEDGSLMIQLSSLGGDEEDRWGGYVLYSYTENGLVLVKRWSREDSKE